MDNEEPPLPVGCWRTLLGFPVLILMIKLWEPWQQMLLPLLPRSLSADAAETILNFSFLTMMLAVWVGILKIVDIVFRTRLFPYGSGDDTSPPTQRAQLRRRGLLIMLAVFGLDQLTKFAFGVAHPFPADEAPDAVIIGTCLGLLLVLFAWWRSRGKLAPLALSLVIGAGCSFVFDYAVRNHLVTLQLSALALPATLADVVGFAGLALYGLSRFWEPGKSGDPPETK
jgi:lipoprotein signal peptidase